jgi:hypothetical protein
VKGVKDSFPLIRLGKQLDEAASGPGALSITEQYNRDGTLKDEKKPIQNHGFLTALSSFFGVPLKDINPEAAANYAKLLGAENEPYFKLKDIEAMLSPEEKIKRKIKRDQDKLKRLSLLGGLNG